MPSAHAPHDQTAGPYAVARVRRNFWALVAATVVAAGVLSQALARPASPGTAVVLALSGLAAVTSVTLAGRILVVTHQLSRRAGTPASPYSGRKA